MELEELKAEVKALRAAVTALVEKDSLLSKTYLNTEETASLLGFTARTVRKYNKSGKLEGRQYTERGRIYFATADVLEFQTKNLRHSAFFGG